IKLKNSIFLGAQLLFFSIFLKNMLLEPDHSTKVLNFVNLTHPNIIQWAGISFKGATKFASSMDAILYRVILSDYLLPFGASNYDLDFKLHQDNEPKHRGSEVKRPTQKLVSFECLQNFRSVQKDSF
ncbi:hypothetical protein BpHYR1_003526, partial [Brachionus plicatilis]